MKKKYTRVALSTLLLQLFLFFSSSPAQWQFEIVADSGNANLWAVADINGDSRPDLTYGNLQSGQIFWYENQPGPWNSTLVNTSNHLQLSGQFAFDLDQDGDQDLFQPQFTTPSLLIWYENIQNGAVFFEYVISDSIGLLTNMFSVVKDIDGDGDLDVAAGDNGNGVLLWFENSGNSKDWTQHNIASFTPNNGRWVTLMDIDGDDDPDYVAVFGDTIVYYENQLPATTWPASGIGASPAGSYNGNGADIDNDGDLDLVTYGGQANRLVWFENPTWQLNIIAEIPQAFLGAIGDIDNDGDVDAFFSGSDGMGWIENLDDGTAWKMTMIDTTPGIFVGPIGQADENGLADFNQDGSIDVAAVTYNFSTGQADIRWYANPAVVGIKNEETPLPAKFALYQNYPNPFNPTTDIGFRIADHGFVELKVYDVSGREVATLVSENLTPGEYHLQWNGKDTSGNQLSSGVYFYRLTAGSFTKTRKMILMK